jgi:cellulose biosynthesis protein BcsQ
MSALMAGVLASGSVSIPLEWIYGTLGAGLAALVTIIVKRSWPHVYAHFSSVWRLRRAEQALDHKSPGLWLSPSIPIEPPADYARLIARSKPIIVIANLKGGVGKTTIAANLIGHYGLKKRRKILVIDIDFQGSLSAVILSQANYDEALSEQVNGSPSKAAQLIEGRDASWVRNVSVDVEGVDSARCIPSYYSLAMMENRVMVEWLIAKRKNDIRYNLANTPHHPDIQDRFDMVIIDAPPRLTTAAVQAFCAATHVLVPTVLDGLSSEATGGFVSQLATNRTLWPHLKLLGVVGNMTELNTADLQGNELDGRLKDYEAEAQTTVRDAVKLALDDAGPSLRACVDAPVFPLNCYIPNKSELGKEAGNRIAYKLMGNGSAAVQDLSRAFDRLGDEIDRRISA